jgi:hypothetical protein
MGKYRKITSDPQRLAELAREKTREALETITEIMRDKEAPPATRLQAAQCLLDRGWGRTPVARTENDQAITVEVVVRDNQAPRVIEFQDLHLNNDEIIDVP